MESSRWASSCSFSTICERFSTLRGENPFVSLNASRIRRIGIVLILGELTNTWFGAWYAERVARISQWRGLTLNADWSINSWVIFSGLVRVAAGGCGGCGLTAMGIESFFVCNLLILHGLLK
jgi:hypothetical protein